MSPGWSHLLDCGLGWNTPPSGTRQGGSVNPSKLKIQIRHYNMLKKSYFKILFRASNLNILREEDAAAPLLPLQGSVILKRSGGDFNAINGIILWRTSIPSMLGNYILEVASNYGKCGHFGRAPSDFRGIC